MSAAEARRRAERCLAVARSTLHEGERAAALGRAEAILAAHGLGMIDLAPGGPRVAQRAFEKSKAPDRYGAADIADALRRYNEALRNAVQAAGAAENETLYAARRRNFAQEVEAAKERDRLRANRGPDSA